MKLLVLCVGLLILDISQAANILGVFNHPGASHTFLGQVLLRNLAKRGHNVTMISAFPLEKPIPNYRDINLTGFLDDMKRRQMMYFDRNPQGEMEDLRNMTMSHTEETFKIPEVQALLNSGQTFDVVIVDFFFNEATWIFGHIFNAPIIISSSFGNNILLNSFTGNSLPYAYVPGAALPTSDDISLKHRLILSALNIFLDWYQPKREANQELILKKFFKDPPTIQELKERIALVLSNSHFSLETPRPYTPNIIPVGGMHIEGLKGLSKELQQFLDNAKEGVVYFSLGSQIKSSNLNKNVLDNLIRTFEMLDLKVLWKFESDNIELPSNVMTSKWISQLDVLAHKNVKMFITHGGMLSTTESIHFGKPMICIPYNGDQLTNAEFIVSRQLGLKVDKNNLTGSDLYNAITEIIRNPRYQERATFYSSLLREQPLSPIDNAIFWVEHVIKHKSGEHLRTFAVKLPWYKYYMLDVIGIVLLVLWLVYLLLKTILKMFCRGICYMFKKKKEKTS